MAKFTVRKMPTWLITLISICAVVVLAVVGIFIYAESTDQSFIDVFKAEQTVEDTTKEEDSDTNIEVNDDEENLETTAVITVNR